MRLLHLNVNYKISGMSASVQWCATDFLSLTKTMRQEEVVVVVIRQESGLTTTRFMNGLQFNFFFFFEQS